jgi:hypothetical protein
LLADRAAAWSLWTEGSPATINHREGGQWYTNGGDTIRKKRQGSEMPMPEGLPGKSLPGRGHGLEPRLVRVALLVQHSINRGAVVEKQTDGGRITPAP